MFGLLFLASLLVFCPGEAYQLPGGRGISQATRFISVRSRILKPQSAAFSSLKDAQSAVQPAQSLLGKKDASLSNAKASQSILPNADISTNSSLSSVESSKRFYAFALQRELQRLQDVDREKVLLALETGNIDFSPQSSEVELRVSLAKAMVSSLCTNSSLYAQTLSRVLPASTVSDTHLALAEAQAAFESIAAEEKSLDIPAVPLETLCAEENNSSALVFSPSVPPALEMLSENLTEVWQRLQAKIVDRETVQLFMDEFDNERQLFVRLRDETLPAAIERGNQAVQAVADNIKTTAAALLKALLPNSVLHPQQSLQVALRWSVSQIMRGLEKIGGWAGGKRMQSSTVLLLSAAFAIWSKQGLLSFAAAILGVKALTAAMNVADKKKALVPSDAPISPASPSPAFETNAVLVPETVLSK